MQTDVCWDLSSLYSAIDDNNIEIDLEKANKLADDFANNYRNKINVSEGLSADTLYNSIKDLEEITKLVYKPDIYASLVFYADTSKPEHGALMQKIQEKVTEVSIKTMFFELELMSVSEDLINKVIDDEKLLEYNHFIKTTRTFTPHKLSEPEEKIMEEKANTGSRAWDRLFDEVLSAAKFEITLEGEVKTLSEPEVLALLKDPNREVRIAAADSLTKGLQNNSRVLTFIFNTLVNDKSINDRLRSYNYPQESRHMSNELSKEVVDLVIDTCVNNYDMVSKFYNIKREILGLDKLTHVDRYAPIFKAKKEVEFDMAKDIVINAFNDFSGVFAKNAKDFFDNNWIDAAPRPGKRGGAFCMSGVPELNPFVLMTYLNKQDDVMTLAHELGHGIHACLSSKLNIFDYHATLPVCENASTFGEILVFEKLVKEADLDDKLALYVEKIESIFATIFRQAAMYKFESELHEARRSRGELTVDDISEIWQRNIQEMFGDSIELGDEHKYWWLYVSHFIGSPFYVYAYSFGELMVLALYGLYKENPGDFVPKYIELLEAGGSCSPEELLAKVGFNVKSSDFWNAGIKTLNNLISDFESIYKEWKNK